MTTEARRRWLKTDKGRAYRRAKKARRRRRLGVPVRALTVGTKASRRKAKILSALGWTCRLCGFGGIPAALHAHHLEPAKKSPRLRAGSPWASLSLAELEAEVAKCMLLCANCHAGVETGWLDLGAALDTGHGP